MTIFCSQELAARIESAEGGLISGGVAAALAREPDGAFFGNPIAGGVAAFGGPFSPLNKVAGLGFAGLPAEEEFAAIEAAYRERGGGVRVELANLADPAIGQWLSRRGYVLIGFENVLGLVLPARLPAVPSGIEIATMAEGEASLWLDVLVTGFATPDEQGVPSDEDFPREVLERAIEDLTAAAGFERYLARIDGHTAGGASLRLADGIAQLTGAATAPAFRRRGVQSALLAHRLELAAKAGCDLAIVTTQPGSKSQQNVQRQGFELLYTRAVLVAPE